MNRILASVAMAALIAGPVAAQDAAPATDGDVVQAGPAAGSAPQEVPEAEQASAQAPLTDAAGTEAVVQVATAAADPGVFQVVRPGDGRMSCEALLAEANALNAEVNAAQNAMGQRTTAFTQAQMRDARVRGGASAAMNLGAMAAGFIPGAALVVGTAQSVANVARQGAAVAQQERRRSQMGNMMEEAQADMERIMPIMNRADHLTDLAMDKGC